MEKRCKWVEVLSSAAAIITAIASVWTLQVNVVERNEVVALQNKATVQEVALSNAVNRVTLYGDILAAGGGDRWAYKRAMECLWSNPCGAKTPEPMLQMLNQLTQLFQSDITNNNLLASKIINLPPPSYDKSNVLSNLTSSDFEKRLNAIGTIWCFRLNNYIPDIVDIAKDESNLNVLQLIIHVVVRTFEDNRIMGDKTPMYYLSLYDCVFKYDEFRKHFMEMWIPAKTRILARKPKEVRERPDTPRGNLIYIYDPEKPDSKE